MDLPNPVSDLASPRRANKACCSCRRNKIKCDSERPCAACLRRNVAHSCVDGCHPCRQSRSYCDGAEPCGRCREQGLDCLDEPVSPIQSTDQASHRPVLSGRAKSACQACRRDNKKCDDSRPCERCTSRREACIHIERNAKAVRQRCINCRRGNTKCEDNRPCRACTESNIECVDAPRRGSARIRVACTNCRQAKVQCDAQRPCRTCVRRGLDCTIPISSCICAETGCAPRTCTFCQLQWSNRSSQMGDSDVQLDESDAAGDDADAPPPSATSKVSAWREAYDLEGQYYPANANMATTPSGRTQPEQHLLVPQQPEPQPNSELSAAAPSAATADFRFPTTANSQAPFSASHPPQHNLSIEQFLENLGDSTGQGTDSLDQYYPAKDLSLGTFTQLDGFVSQSSSQYTPSMSGLSSPMTTGFTTDSYSHAGVGVGVGVGVGFGMYGPRGTPEYSSMPMAMPVPVAVTIPVQRGGRKDADTQGGAAVSLSGLHPQLRRAVDYLLSESRSSRSQ